MLTFKKSIACLMSLIMIMTVTPFTAVTASAATVKSVSSNIDATNKKYNAAPSTTLSETGKFIPKKGLSQVAWSSSGEVLSSASVDEQNHSEKFAPSSNVLYWPSDYTGNSPCINIKSDSAVFFKMFYPTAVLLWDGSTDAYIPIVSLIANNVKGVIGIDTDPNRTIFYGAPYDYERGSATTDAHSANFYADTWRGIEGEKSENFNRVMYEKGTEIGFGSEVLTEDSTVSKYYKFGAKKENDTASFLHINPTIDFGNKNYLTQNIYWTFNTYKNTSFNVTDDNNTYSSDSTTYVVNYKPVVDKANEAIEYLKTFEKTDYTPDAVNDYYSAVQALFDFDPNDYFILNDDSNRDVNDRVVDCSNKITSLVEKYDTAYQNLQNNKQYRIKFTNIDNELIFDNYCKADSTFVVPNHHSDELINNDPDGHYTKTYKWEPEASAVATASVSYVEKAEIPAVKTPHNYGAYSKVTQEVGGVEQNGHSRTCSECGYKDWALCDSFYVEDTEKYQPASCTQDEIRTYECSVCGRIKTEVGEKKTDHDYEVVSPQVDATCETAGKTEVKKCKNCGDTIGGKVIKAKGHKYTVLVSKEQEATCTADGKKAVYKCENCDETQGGAVIPALGHNYQYIEAENKIVCSRCGDERKVGTSDAVPEGYTLVETVEPTCTKIGYTVYENNTGDKFYNDIKPATDHQYGEATVVDPTCTEDGYTVRICTVCKDEEVVTNTGSKLGHNYNKVVTAPTYDAGGYTTYTCSRCGDTYQADFTAKLVKPADETPSTPTTPSTPSAPTTPTTPSTPALTPGESTIANDYGVDSATAKLIYIYLTQNNISSDTSSLTEKVMTGTPVKGDGDYKGSNFGLLKAQTTKITKNSVTVKWNKVKNADGYIVYGAKCGAKSKYKVLKVVSGKTTSYTQNKLKKGTYYKYNIVAFKNINGAKVTTAVSKKVHATTLGGKYGVAKSVKVNKTKATIKKGKTFKIKASEIKKDKTIKRHRAVCYESSNTSVATVDAKGKVKGVKKGKCTIYVYAQNGVYKTVNITVK